MSLQATIPIPGNGSDELCLGQVYILSILNTNEVLTALGGEAVKLRRFENSRNQKWRLDPHAANRHTFMNVETGDFLCIESGAGFLSHRSMVMKQAEQFTMIPRKTGGYLMYNHYSNCPYLLIRPGNEDCLRTTTFGDAFTIIGVHCAE